MKIKIFLFITFSFVICDFVCQAESAQSIWNRGCDMAAIAQKNNDKRMFVEALKLMEQAAKIDNTNGDWYYEIGQRYCFAGFRNDGAYVIIDKDKGLKWIEKAADLGNIYAALFFHEKYKPLYAPSIWDPCKEWKRHQKDEHKSEAYASIALAASIPPDFNNYLSLAKAASYLHEYERSGRYAAKAIDNNEYGAVDFVLEYPYVLYSSLDFIKSNEGRLTMGKALCERGETENVRKKGLKLIEKSAKAGCGDAQDLMAGIYLQGKLVEADTLKALAWVKLAAKNKNAGAMYVLAICHANGIEVEKDSCRVFELLRQSSELGFKKATMLMGLCNHFGFGTAINQEKARDYFKSSCTNTEIDYFLARTYYRENSKDAIVLFSKAIENKDLKNKLIKSDILRKLSSCYRTGRCGVEIDINKSNNLLKEASKCGDTEISDIMFFLKFQ